MVMGLIAVAAGCQQAKDVRHLPANPSGQTFGHRQLDQMLADRPDMAAAIPLSHPVREWLAAGFNGQLVGRRVYWLADEPESGLSAEHAPEFENYPPHIRIANDHSSPIDKWASAVYEMFNMSNTEEFEAVRDQALAGKIDADTYAEQCVRLEFKAVLQTRGYFKENPLPGSSWKDEWYCWVTEVDDSYEDYKRSHGTVGSHGNFQYFRQYYLDEIVPYQENSR